MTRHFGEMLRARWAEGKHVCVGLDPDPAMMPASFRDGGTVAFCRAIVAATDDLVCAYKPNAAFFEAMGAPGLDALTAVVADIRAIAPDVPVIYDAKRGDIGNTNAGYVRHAFDLLGTDAITVSPYLGRTALMPFLDRAEKGVFVLCRTSNPGADEFQTSLVDGAPLYEVVARRVAEHWNDRENCGLVVGATDPAALARVRAIAGGLPILVPGIGAQGGAVGADVEGLLISASRSILYASAGPDFAAAARAETQRLHAALGR